MVPPEGGTKDAFGIFVQTTSETCAAAPNKSRKLAFKLPTRFVWVHRLKQLASMSFTSNWIFVMPHTTGSFSRTVSQDSPKLYIMH